MMKKRLIAATAALVVVSAFTGCSDTDEDTSSTKSTSESTVTSEAEDTTSTTETSKTEATSEDDADEDPDLITDAVVLPAPSAPMNETILDDAMLDESVYANLLDTFKDGSYTMKFSYKIVDEFSTELIDYTYITNGDAFRADCISEDYSEISLSVDGKDYVLLPDEKKCVDVSEDALNEFMEGVETGMEAATAVTEDHDGHEHSEDGEDVSFFISDPYDFLVDGTAVSANICEIDGNEYYRVMFETDDEDDNNQYYAYFDNDNKLTYTAVTSNNNIINLQASDFVITGDIDESLLSIPEDYEKISFEAYMNFLMAEEMEDLEDETTSSEDIITEAE